MACETFTLIGIDKIYYQETDSFNYFITGDTVILTGGTFNRLNVVDDQSSFVEKAIVDQRGTYYNDTFDLHYSNHANQEPFDLQNSSLVFLFKDNNANWYISGYDQPLTGDKFDVQLNEKNEISFSVGCDSYQKARQAKITLVTFVD